MYESQERKTKQHQWTVKKKRRYWSRRNLENLICLWDNQLKRALEELGDSRLRTLRNAQSYDAIRQSALLVRIRSAQLN